MAQNYRHFQAGPDPAGRTWQVDLMWMQTAIAIRHSDCVDVKFLLANGDMRQEKVIALRHPDLLELSAAAGRPLTDPWCIKLAAMHLLHMIGTGDDMEKALVTVERDVLRRYAMDTEESS
jgi:hypothetical protein